jgi:hypothetical protein
MAYRNLKSEAITMRRKGASYSQIRENIKVSKSTLSLWLRDLPLSDKRIRELRDFSEIRIEKYRETRRKKRESRWDGVRVAAEKTLGSLSERELLIAGLFLYWGEGTKTTPHLVCVSNTDPVMLRFFIRWLTLLGVPKKRLRVKIHLYKDMDVQKEQKYWSKILNIPLAQFRKPYVKSSNQSGLSYPQRFKHGTGNVMFGNRDVAERVSMSLDYIRSMFGEKAV